LIERKKTPNDRLKAVFSLGRKQNNFVPTTTTAKGNEFRRRGRYGMS
jgi:hypothetical protein